MTELNERVAALEVEVRMLRASYQRIIDRLLDGVVPQIQLPDTQPSDHPESPADDSDWDGAMDWTDPFIGIERQRDYREVGHLAPGEMVPGVGGVGGGPGVGMPTVPASTESFTRIGDTDAMIRWRQMGQESFDEWNDDARADGGPGGQGGVSMIAPLEVE